MTAHSSLKKVLLPKAGFHAHFMDRGKMRRRGVRGVFHHFKFSPPVTNLPVDSTGNAAVSCPMDDNDQFGICGPAMCAHVYNILTFRQGQATEATVNVANLLAQYLKVSGGDNGTDESMLVGQNGIWITGLAGDTNDVVVDSLDIDLTNTPLVQYAIDQFYTVQMAWSVPDVFVDTWESGTVWPNAMTPDPENGHYTPLADVAGPIDVLNGVQLNGFYRLWTWGGWCWVSPAFVDSVQPQGFIAFSPRQFSLQTGLDSKGRHITTQAAKWEQAGGNTIPQSIISLFPPFGPNPPTPTPPVPPSNTLQQQVDAVFASLESQYKHNPNVIQALGTAKVDIDKIVTATSHR